MQSASLLELGYWTMNFDVHGTPFLEGLGWTPSACFIGTNISFKIDFNVNLIGRWLKAELIEHKIAYGTHLNHIWVRALVFRRAEDAIKFIFEFSDQFESSSEE